MERRQWILETLQAALMGYLRDLPIAMDALQESGLGDRYQVKWLASAVASGNMPLAGNLRKKLRQIMRLVENYR